MNLLISATTFYENTRTESWGLTYTHTHTHLVSESEGHGSEGVIVAREAAYSVSRGRILSVEDEEDDEPA